MTGKVEDTYEVVEEIQEEHGGSDEKPLAAGEAMAVDTAVSTKSKRILLESGIEDREERKPRVSTTLINPGTHPVQRKKSWKLKDSGLSGLLTG